MKKNIRIISIFLLFISMSIILTGCKKKENTNTLNVYNWGDYIDPEVLTDFEKEYNIKINYNTFATNEDMYIAIKKGGTPYDVAFPSDYMIERMIDEELLEPLDKSKLTNIKNIDEKFLDLSFDHDNIYSMPYMWGTVGIVYNTLYVDESEVSTWDVLWDDKYNKEILMLDSQRDTFAVALLKLGYSINTRNSGELEEAKNLLIEQKPLVYAYIGDEVKDLMVAEEAKMAVVWSGDAVVIADENENIAYSIPKEGTNLWFDNMVIPKNAKNKEMANEFLNYMQRPDIAARNTEYIGYSTPNFKAKELLPEDMQENYIMYPSDEEILNTEIFGDPKDILRVYDDLWIELKAAR